MWTMKCGSQIFQYSLDSLPIQPLDSRDPRLSLVLAICSPLLRVITAPSSWHSLMFFTVVMVTTIATWAGHNPLIARDVRYCFTQFPCTAPAGIWAQRVKPFIFSWEKYFYCPKISLLLRFEWRQGNQDASMEKQPRVISPTLKSDPFFPDPLFIASTLCFHSNHSIWVQGKGFIEWNHSEQDFLSKIKHFKESDLVIHSLQGIWELSRALQDRGPLVCKIHSFCQSVTFIKDLP